MSENISKMIEQIKGMTVVELSELIKSIETEFDVSAAAPAAVAVAGPAAAADAGAEKTEFTVMLKDAGAKKISVIKALRAIDGTLSLKDAKDKVEAAPVAIAEKIAKDEAEKMKETLTAAGATAELV